MDTRCVHIKTYALVRRWVSFGRLRSWLWSLLIIPHTKDDFFRKPVDHGLCPCIWSVTLFDEASRKSTRSPKLSPCEPLSIIRSRGLLTDKTFGVLAFQHDTKVCKFNHALRFGALCGRLYTTNGIFYRALYVDVLHHSYLVDPASSHMLVSKIKPCMSKYKHPLYCETAYSSLYQQLFIWWSILTWITVVILELIHAYKSQCKLQMYLLDKESIPVLLVLLMNHNNCSNRTRKRR